MKRIVFACLMLSGCAVSKVIPLKGSYPQTPIISSTDKPFDKVWDNIIDYFAQKGIPIRIIDRSSGLIISDKASLSWSFEDKNGALKSPHAYVVLQTILDKMHEKPFIPASVTGEWNVRIKNADGKTTVNVNLYNIEATYGSYYYSVYTHSMITPVKVDGKTTGVFEQTIYDAVK